VTHTTKQKNDDDNMQENEVGTKLILLSSEKKAQRIAMRVRERKKKVK
jgi:phage gp46-like protein